MPLCTLIPSVSSLIYNCRRNMAGILPIRRKTPKQSNNQSIFYNYRYLFSYDCFHRMTPLGISSLIAASIASTRDVTGTFSSLGLFVLTVTIGIVLHQALFIPLILFLITRRNPFTYFISIGRAWLIGFAATST